MAVAAPAAGGGTLNAAAVTEGSAAAWVIFATPVWPEKRSAAPAVVVAVAVELELDEPVGPVSEVAVAAAAVAVPAAAAAPALAAEAAGPASAAAQVTGGVTFDPAVPAALVVSVLATGSDPGVADVAAETKAVDDFATAWIAVTDCAWVASVAVAAEVFGTAAAEGADG